MYSDVVCNIIASPDHIIRNYYIVEDTSGVFSLFSGIASLEFSENDVGIGTGRYVYQGGSDFILESWVKSLQHTKKILSSMTFAFRVQRTTILSLH